MLIPIIRSNPSPVIPLPSVSKTDEHVLQWNAFPSLYPSDNNQDSRIDSNSWYAYSLSAFANRYSTTTTTAIYLPNNHTDYKNSVQCGNDLPRKCDYQQSCVLIFRFNPFHKARHVDSLRQRSFSL